MFHLSRFLSSAFLLNSRCQFHITQTVFFKTFTEAAGNPILTTCDQAWKEITALYTHCKLYAKDCKYSHHICCGYVTIYISHFFLYIPSQWLSKHSWVVFQNDGEKCLSNGDLSIEYLFCFRWALWQTFPQWKTDDIRLPQFTNSDVRALWLLKNTNWNRAEIYDHKCKNREEELMVQYHTY